MTLGVLILPNRRTRLAVSERPRVVVFAHAMVLANVMVLAYVMVQVCVRGALKTDPNFF